MTLTRHLMKMSARLSRVLISTVFVSCLFLHQPAHSQSCCTGPDTVVTYYWESLDGEGCVDFWETDVYYTCDGSYDYTDTYLWNWDCG